MQPGELETGDLVPMGGAGPAFCGEGEAPTNCPPSISLRRALSPVRVGARGAGGRSHLQLWRNESGTAVAAERVWHPESPGIENNLGKAVGGVCARSEGRAGKQAGRGVRGGGRCHPTAPLW